MIFLIYGGGGGEEVMCYFDNRLIQYFKIKVNCLSCISIFVPLMFYIRKLEMFKIDFKKCLRYSSEHSWASRKPLFCKNNKKPRICRNFIFLTFLQFNWTFAIICFARCGFCLQTSWGLRPKPLVDKPVEF